MANITASPTKTNIKNENKAVTAFDPTFLTALQDMATYYGVELWGNYAKTGKVAISGDTFKGSFHLHP